MISVVIPARDEERLLPACLASVLACRPFEVIVVDNGSRDRTAELARAAGARVIACGTPGAVHAKAAGVAAARAPLVAVIDADSMCPPDWLARIHAELDADPELVGLSGPARYHGARAWVHAVMWFWYGFWRLASLLAGDALYAVGTNVAFRRDAFERAGGFDTALLVGGDELGLFGRLRRVGRTRYLPDLVVTTDPRRTRIGFLRFFFSLALVGYLLNYAVYRLTGRALVTRYPPGSQLDRDQLRKS